MARKGKKRKNNKKPKRLNITKFGKSFCNKCQVCYVGCQPTYCYDVVYKQDPNLFTRMIWPELKYLYIWPEDYDRSEQSFVDIFCGSGMCGKEYMFGGCAKIKVCHSMFIDQINHQPDVDFTNHTNNGNPSGCMHKSVGAKSSKHVDKTKRPTFFTNGNEEWVAKMEKILYGDDSVQQDSVKKCAG